MFWPLRVAVRVPPHTAVAKTDWFELFQPWLSLFLTLPGPALLSQVTQKLC